MDYRTELRTKKPGKAMAADHERSRHAAIHLHCETCAGSTAEAGRCPAVLCFLWPFRPGAGGQDDPRRVRPAGVVPTAEEYAAMLPQYTDEERAAMTEQMRKTRARDEEDEG